VSVIRLPYERRIGDYREKGKLYPVHVDTIIRVREIGFTLKGTTRIGTEFMMSHDYVFVFDKAK